MEFRILGPLEVEVNGRLIPLGGVKQRILLAKLLLDANRVVSTERLLGALWPEGPPPSGPKALQMHVSQLRRTLNSASSRELIATRAPGYVIALEADELDLSRFERLIDEARRGTAVDTAAALRLALGLWCGPPLADFHTEPFARSEITRLESMRLDTLEDLFETELASGRHHDVVTELEGVAAEHPLRERLRAQLMLALYRCGRQVQALEVYQDTRRHLTEELGIEPGRPLQDLERAVLQHDPALDLSRETAAVPVTVEGRSQPEAPGRQAPERKLATVLFADLVGSTELGEQSDPERTRALLETFYDAMAAEIAASGGTTEKFVGDAVMAAFGAPVAHEDHATRALHAAVAMRARLEEEFSGNLALRVGVCTGEVVVGAAREGSSFVTGDSVNVAARLEQLAEPGEILVGERTVAAARGVFEFAALKAIEVRGKRGRVTCARLLGPLATQQLRGAPMLRRAFVGRETELELLRASYVRALQEEGAHLVTILGEAGVGKTSLVGALAEALSSGSPPPRWWSGRCAAYGRGLTFRPLGEILKEYLGILDSDPPPAVRRSLGGRDILGLTLDIDVAQDLPPIVARERLHDAWVDLVEEMVATEPAVILIEDLHWADEELLDLLERLLADVRASILLVATARPELLDRRPGWSGGRRNTITLALEPLSHEESGRLIDGLADVPVPARLRRLVLDRVEGNPFFLEELLATLIDRGDLERRGGDWLLREPRTDLTAPDSVQAVLAARIDLLPPQAKAALQAAAVIGRTFWAGPVSELMGGAQVDLSALEERDFVRRRPASSLAGEREYAFKHALTREVAFSGLTKASRARLHAAFAAWLERVGGGRDEQAALLADHYAEAARPEDADLAWANEPLERERLRRKAIAWLTRAAALAAGRYAIDEQAVLLRRAAELEDRPAARSAIWRQVADAVALTFERQPYEEAMLRALEDASEPELRAELYSQLAFETVYRWRHGEDLEAIQGWIDEALALAGPSTAARARALVARSYCADDAAERAADAIEIVERLPDLRLRAYAFHASADNALIAGDYEEATRWAERRLELASGLGDPDLLADALWSTVPGYAGVGRFEDARRAVRLQDEVTSELTAHHRLHGIAGLLEVEELAGDWRRIADLTERAERAVEENSAVPCVHNPRSLLVCALAAAYLGDDDRARRLEALTTSLGVEDYGRLFDVRTRFALLRRDLASVTNLIADWEQPGRALIRSLKLTPIAAKLDALAALGDRERIEREASAYVREGTYLEPFALRALGIVRGEEGLLIQATDRFRALGLDWHARQTEHGAAMPTAKPARP